MKQFALPLELNETSIRVHVSGNRHKFDFDCN